MVDFIKEKTPKSNFPNRFTTAKPPKNIKPLETKEPDIAHAELFKKLFVDNFFKKKLNKKLSNFNNIKSYLF